jgi:hypothetical protein
MVSLDVAERPDRTRAAPASDARSLARRRPSAMTAGLALTFVLALAVRLLAHDLVITADEDNWMRRAGGFTYGLLNGQFGRTYQNGHPGVTTMWVAMLTLGPDRMVQYADRVHNQRLVGRVPGFWEALVDARVGFALVTAALVTLIAGLAWRLFGPLVGMLSGLIVGLEPFYLAISQLVHMDAILSGTMVASVLAALVAWERDGGRRWLVASGILGGLALLSKSPAVYLLAFVPLLGLVTLAPWPGADVAAPHPGSDGASGAPSRGEPLTRPLSRAAADLAIWSLALVVTIVAGWPAIWVLGPGEVLSRVVAFTRETGGQPHEQGTFFLGAPRSDPGLYFYPVAMAFRLAPITLLGLLLLVLSWRDVPRDHRRPTLALVAYAVGFLAMMTLGAKKFDRYLLPDFPALGVLAAVGIGAEVARFTRRRQARSPGRQPWLATALLGMLLAGFAARPAYSTYPYYLSYYNPLIGGGPTAQRTVMVGNGEGLDQVAAWLNARPNAADQWVVSDSFDILQALIVGSGESLRDRVPSNADYVVLYRFQTQINHSPRVLEQYWDARTPEHVVWINGIEYARIYRGPHLDASAAGPEDDS